ncbi:glucose 1-dehydrogenase [Actinacidiphila glaucinigra]|uniref:SDR family NAD(P)-dependent oxidoreductase n=1 Tax=Actinacidiphila glaucinigra TaxID=235986 RepID=UPI003870D1CA
MERVTGKVAIVTGAAQGMGAASAELLVKEGAKVAVADVKEAEGRALADKLGPNAMFVKLDVTDPASWAEAVVGVETAFGTVDVLVNNAGIADVGPLTEWDLPRLRRVLEVNLIGAFNGIQAVEPAMRRARRGSIINFGSLGGMKAFPLMSGYVASKWAVRGLTKVAALELGRHGIRVNAVHPGQVNTPMTDGVEFKVNNVALQRVGEPEEIAELVLFLASDESRFVTGVDLLGDGGEFAGAADWASIPD